MIFKVYVLFPVKHLQQCAGRVAVKIGTKLVYFIKKQQRIHTSRFTHSGGNPSRHRPYICTAVTADFRLIAHTAQSNASISSVHSLCNAFGNRRFTHTGRSDKTKNLPSVSAQSAHRKMFQHKALDLFHTVMVFIKHIFGKRQVGI